MEKNAVLTDRKGKALLVAPLIVLPFLTLILWSFKVVGSVEQPVATSSRNGLNLKLPGAKNTDDSSWNKLKFYEQADRDSAKYRSMVKADPYFKSMTISPFASRQDTSSNQLRWEKDKGLDIAPGSVGGQLLQARDANEAKVYRKLAELNLAIKHAENAKDTIPHHAAPVISDDKMRALGRQDRTGTGEVAMPPEDKDDGQLRRMDGMLDKILDIQHPDRVQLQAKPTQRPVFDVVAAKEDIVSLIGRQQDSSLKGPLVSVSPRKMGNSFFSLESDMPDSLAVNTVRAMIPESQSLVSGATVKLRLLSDISVKGVIVPGGEFVYGTVSLAGERLSIHIGSILYRGRILPVSLSVFDLDGIAGIYVPGTITRDVTKQSTDQAIQSLSLASLDQSIGAQAATAGIEAAKTLVSRKVKLIRVKIPADYEVFLHDDGEKR